MELSGSAAKALQESQKSVRTSGSLLDPHNATPPRGSDASLRGSRGSGEVTSPTRSTSFLLPVVDEKHHSERLRLAELLRGMSPQALQLSLLSQLTLSEDTDSERRRTVQAALSAIFPAPRDANREAAHCARCHGSFDAKFNRGVECKIAHSETAKHDLVKRTTAQSVWKLSCCGAKIVQPGDAERPVLTEEIGYCYAGPHAASSDEVEWYNMITIFRCNSTTPSRSSSTLSNASPDSSFRAPKPCTRPHAATEYSTVLGSSAGVSVLGPSLTSAVTSPTVPNTTTSTLLLGTSGRLSPAHATAAGMQRRA